MPIVVRCVGCSKTYELPEAQAGRKVRCTNCGSAFLIPSPTPTQTETPAGADLGRIDRLDDALAEQSAGAAPSNPFGGAPRRSTKQGMSTGMIVGLSLGGVAALALLLVVAGLVINGLSGDDSAEVAQEREAAPRVERPSLPDRSTRDGPTTPTRPEPSPILEDHDTPSGSATMAGSGWSLPGSDAQEQGPEFWNARSDPPVEVLEYPEKLSFSLGKLPKSCSISYPAIPSRFALLTAESSGFDDKIFFGVVDLIDGKAAGQCILPDGRDMGMDSIQADLSPDGKLFAAAMSREGMLQVRSVASGALVCEIDLERSLERSFMNEGGDPPQFCFAGPNRLLAVGGESGDPQIKVFDAQSGDMLRVLTLDEGGGFDFGKLADVDQRPERSFSGGRNKNYAFDVSPGGRYAAVFHERALWIWDIESGEMLGTSHLGSPSEEDDWSRRANLDRISYSVKFSPDGTEIAALSKHELACWDASSGEVLLCEALDFNKREPMGADRYRGIPLDWLPGGEGWLYQGRVVLDRQTASPIWTFPESNGTRVRMIDLKRVVFLAGNFFTDRMLTVAELPISLDEVIHAIESGGGAVDAVLPPLTERDLSGIREVALDAASDTWSVVADPADMPSIGKPLPIGLGDVEEHVASVRFSRDRLKAVALRAKSSGFGRSFGQEEDVGSFVECHDIEAGERVQQIRLAGSHKLLDTSPLGELALLLVAPKGSKRGTPACHDRLDIWSLETAEHATAWRPYKGESDETRGVAWAKFVARDHVLTLSTGGKLVLWQLPMCKAVYAIRDVSLDAAMSPDGGYLLVRRSGDSTYQLLNPMTGDSDGQLESTANVLSAKHVAFHPAGSLLAAISEDHVICWDLEDGKITQESPLIAVQPGPIRWSGERSLLIQRSLASYDLLDVEKGFVIWRYRVAGSADVTSAPDDRLWFTTLGGVGRGSTSIMGAMAMPSADVRRQTDHLTADDIAILRPGGTVSLSASISGADSGRVESALRRVLEGNGVTVDSQSPVSVRVTSSISSTGQQLTAENRSAGFREKSEPEVFDQKQMTITLEIRNAGGRSYRSVMRVPMRSFGIVGGGESAQSQLFDEMSKSAEQRAGSFSIPKFVLPNDGSHVIGSSTLSLAGETLSQ